MKKVLKWLGIGLLAFTVLGIIAVASDDSSDKTASAKSSADLSYNVVKKEKQSDGLYLRITVNDRLDRKDVVEILRRAKEENSWKDKFVAWFYVKQFSESGAWATAAYLPECDNCETDKDSDGNSVQYHLLGLTPSKADSLRPLSLDTIPNKKLLVGYLEDISQCKTEIYEVDGQSNRLLRAQIYGPGQHVLSWLKLNVENGEERYYFEDEDDDEGNYMVYEPATKVVHFRNKEGKEWQTFQDE